MVAHLRLVHSVTPAPLPPAVPAPMPVDRWNLSSHDLVALSGWMRRSDIHGYRRMLIEIGTGSEEPEEGGYALLYGAEADWANYGISRHGDEIVVWHCASGMDEGRFETMDAALDSLPLQRRAPDQPDRRAASRTREASPVMAERSKVISLA